MCFLILENEVFGKVSAEHSLEGPFLVKILTFGLNSCFTEKDSITDYYNKFYTSWGYVPRDTSSMSGQRKLSCLAHLCINYAVLDWPGWEEVVQCDYPNRL